MKIILSCHHGISRRIYQSLGLFTLLSLQSCAGGRRIFHNRNLFCFTAHVPSHYYHSQDSTTTKLYLQNSNRNVFEDQSSSSSSSVKSSPFYDKNISRNKPTRQYKKIQETSETMTPQTEAIVIDKIHQRNMARRQKNYSKADDILDELRFIYHVQIDDDTKTWRVLRAEETLEKSSTAFYQFGGKRLTNVSSDQLTHIESILRQRIAARKGQDFPLADRLLRELEVQYGVRVDDKKRSWHFHSAVPSTNRSKQVSNSNDVD